MVLWPYHTPQLMSRPVRGVWVEIILLSPLPILPRVTSRKGRVSRNHCMLIIFGDLFLSRPVRGVWVEIVTYLELALQLPSRPVRGVWVEMELKIKKEPVLPSRPVRGVWVEIFIFSYFSSPQKVTSRKGRVSRNNEQKKQGEEKRVTSRKGRVSRNCIIECFCCIELKSRPVRGVWIEISAGVVF